MRFTRSTAINFSGFLALDGDLGEDGASGLAEARRVGVHQLQAGVEDGVGDGRVDGDRLHLRLRGRLRAAGARGLGHRLFEELQQLVILLRLAERLGLRGEPVGVGLAREDPLVQGVGLGGPALLAVAVGQGVLEGEVLGVVFRRLFEPAE